MDAPQVDSDVQDMLHDAFGMYEDEDNTEPTVPTEGPSLSHGPTPDVQRFYQLLKDADTELYPGAGKKKLDFLISGYSSFTKTRHNQDEAAIAGPVQFRWMYLIERYLHDLKKYVRNRSRPEASIEEDYIIEECLSFCSMYLSDGVESKRTRIGRNADDPGIVPCEGLPLFIERGRSIESGHEFRLTEAEWEHAHTHVLINCPQIKQYLDDHIANTKRTRHRRTIFIGGGKTSE
ncbi:hypothetical protein M0R45_031002 [Rubus argutus]|uniref:DUF4218 domain-containing protein n=1 Tax=Rubus argutus TaxID=59490 RepID=A0AAW1WEW4_RUBAR